MAKFNIINKVELVVNYVLVITGKVTGTIEGYDGSVGNI